MNIGVTFDFEKADSTGRFVRGFASVSTVGGKLVEDHQSDVITMDELTKAAHQFITDARVAKAMHDGSQIGEVVESVMVDDAFAKALGASTDKRGWWIGMKITDPKVQKRIASGELKAFSIGGRGTRKKIEKAISHLPAGTAGGKGGQFAPSGGARGAGGGKASSHEDQGDEPFKPGFGGEGIGANAKHHVLVDIGTEKHPLMEASAVRLPNAGPKAEYTHHIPGYSENQHSFVLGQTVYSSTGKTGKGMKDGSSQREFTTDDDQRAWVTSGGLMYRD